MSDSRPRVNYSALMDMEAEIAPICPTFRTGFVLRSLDERQPSRLAAKVMKNEIERENRRRRG